MVQYSTTARNHFKFQIQHIYPLPENRKQVWESSNLNIHFLIRKLHGKYE